MGQAGRPDSVAQLLQATVATDENAAARALERARVAVLESPGRVGRYTLGERIGAGGLGVVHRGRDTQLQRDVAIKLIHPHVASHRPAAARARFLREAQSLGRLAHPNVVEIYDWGASDDGALYLVMELVHGVTLDRWIEDEPRGWEQILDVLRAAGAGLAAAHERGLVHRDFKPTNVIVGADGRVRVLDFGLARSLSQLDAPEPDGVRPAASGVAEQISTASEVVGTLDYMAPEQLRRRPADPRSDQFAFCVTAWSLLYGVHPFAGATRRELAERVKSQRIVLGRRLGVPGFVRAALRKGLSASPSRRHASMAVLLRRLQRPRWSRIVTGVGVGAVALGAALSFAGEEPACADAQTRLAGALDPETRRSIADALIATGASYARPTAAWVDAALESYAEDWRNDYEAACRSESQRRGRHVECLERSLAGATAIVRVLQQVDMVTLEHAAKVVEALPSPAACTAAAPHGSARVQAELSRAEALVLAGRDAEAVDAAELAASSAEANADFAALSRARLLQARVHRAAWDVAGAEAAVAQASAAAERARRPDLAVEALAAAVHLVGVDLARFDEAEVLAATAQGAVAPLMDEPLATARVLHAVGMLRYAQGRYDEAVEALARGLALAEDTLGGDELALRTRTGLGLNYTALGRFEDAHRVYGQALEVLRLRVGPLHPRLATIRLNDAVTSAAAGDSEGALVAMQGVHAILRDTLGPNHPTVGRTLLNLGAALQLVGRPDEALVSARAALAVFQTAFGPEHPDTAAALNNIGAILVERGRFAEALEPLLSALVVKQRVLGSRHVDVAHTLYGLGRAYEGLAMRPLAVAHYARALAIWTAVRDGPSMADAAQRLWALSPAG